MQPAHKKEWLFGMITRRTRVTKIVGLDDHNCGECGLNTTEIVVKSGYADFGGIPLFPVDKEIEVYCYACESTVKEQDFSEVNRQLSTHLKNKVRHPWFSFIAPYAMIVILLITSIVLTQRSIYKNRLKAPELYDVYVIYNHEPLSEYPYTLWRVVTVDTDSLWITTNTYSYDKPPTIMHPLDQFYDSMFWMSRQKTMELYKEGTIVSVERDLHPRGEVFERLNMPDSQGY
ncbi:MAG: hypothetical protein Roseis2KO_24180 [Roseivirga sp.]